ncbi:MAG TPA: peptidase M4 family protein, partial [Kribbellaceae bacterium]|nr:peptidase M4 family protein [Kribbellaceae bacterium]
MRRRTPIIALALLVVGAVGSTVTSALADTTPALTRSTDPAAAAADALVASSSATLRKSPGDTLVRTAMHNGTNGLKYFAYERAYRGLQVVGGDLVV